MPHIFTGTEELFVAQMLNLDLIDGINFQKGCYPGQEIVARMKYLGKLKKRLAYISYQPTTIENAHNIQSEQKNVGQLLYSSKEDMQQHSLAVINIEAIEKNALSIIDNEGQKLHVRIEQQFA